VTKEVKMGLDKQRAVTVTLVLIAVLCVGYIGYTVAKYLWQQNITWNYIEPVEHFSVNRENTPINYGDVIGATTKTETYIITNDGTVPITVSASASVTGATASWNQESAPIPVGGQATFTLTLTITGAGSCTVTFAS
jgi:hypothetical protein